MKSKKFILIPLLFLVIFLLFPLIILLSNVINIGTLNNIFIEKLIEALKNSVLISIIVSIISILISYIVSYLIVKYHYKNQKIILMFLTLPMLVPTFTHALGFISIWGRNGLLNNLLGSDINIYGFWGIVLCLICYSLPISLIMFVDLLSSEDETPYKVADTLGIPKYSQFINIKISYILKPTLFIMFTIFTMSITDYGIPMMIGGNTLTLTTMIYEQIVGRLNFANASLIGLMLLVPAIIMFILGLLMKKNNSFEYKLNDESHNNSFIKILSSILFILVFVFLSFPLISSIFISFMNKFPQDMSFSLSHVIKVIKEGYLKYLLNSIIISFLSANIGTILSFIMSYIVTRIKDKKLSKIFHLFAIFTSSIPGIVLAVSYMFAFNKTIIYGTIIILIIINIVRYMGNPYLILFNKLSNINKEIENTALTLGIPKKNIIVDVIIPQILPSIIEGFSFIFVNTMASVTTMLFLSTAFTKPLALVIVDLEAHNFIEMAAFVSLIILITNIIIKSLVILVSKKYNSNKEKNYPKLNQIL